MTTPQTHEDLMATAAAFAAYARHALERAHEQTGVVEMRDLMNEAYHAARTAKLALEAAALTKSDSSDFAGQLQALADELAEVGEIPEGSAGVVAAQEVLALAVQAVRRLRAARDAREANYAAWNALDVKMSQLAAQAFESGTEQGARRSQELDRVREQARAVVLEGGKTL
jgi:hypothetical protein